MKKKHLPKKENKYKINRHKNRKTNWFLMFISKYLLFLDLRVKEVWTHRNN